MKVESYFDEALQKTCWRFDFTLKGKRFRKDGWQSEKEARDVIQKLTVQAELKALGLLPPAKPTITLKDLSQAQQKDSSVPRKERAQIVLTQIISVLGGNMRLTDLKKTHLRQVREHFEKQDLMPGTVVNYLGFFSAALHRAPSYFEELNEWQPPAIPRPKRDDGRERVLTKVELGKLFTELNKQDRLRDLGDAMRMMLLTGARRGELAGITLAEVNQDWKTYQIKRGTKTSRKRIVPLSATALAIIESREAPLLKSHGQQWFYKEIKKASTRAGVVYGDNVDGGWVAHDLRHTAATVIESAGIKYSTVAALLGHKRRDQTATYTHSNLEDLRKAVSVLETWCQDIDGFDRLQSSLIVAQTSAL